MEKLIKELIEMINSKHGENLIVFDVSEVTTISKYIFILSTNSQTHANSISGHIIDFLIEKNYGKYLMSKNFSANNPWILIDSSDILFHVFQRETRDFYNLEKLYFRGKIFHKDKIELVK